MVKKYVWLLEEVDWGYAHVVGVFSSREKAFEAKKGHRMLVPAAELAVLPYELDRAYEADPEAVEALAGGGQK